MSNEPAQTLFLLDGEEVGFSELSEDNAEDEWFLDLLAGMEVGEEKRLGGGAAPLTHLKRIR